MRIKIEEKLSLFHITYFTETVSLCVFFKLETKDKMNYRKTKASAML